MRSGNTSRLVRAKATRPKMLGVLFATTLSMNAGWLLVSPK